MSVIGKIGSFIYTLHSFKTWILSKIKFDIFEIIDFFFHFYSWFSQFFAEHVFFSYFYKIGEAIDRYYFLFLYFNCNILIITNGY